MSKKTYTPAFKAKVVLEVLQGESELSAIAAKYDLNPNMVGYVKDFSHILKESFNREDNQRIFISRFSEPTAVNLSSGSHRRQAAWP